MQKERRDGLWAFFRALKEELGLAGLTRQIYSELMSAINAGRSADFQLPDDDDHYHRLCQKNPTASQELVDGLIRAVPTVKAWQRNEALKVLFKAHTGEDFSQLAPDRAVFNLRRDEQTPLNHGSKLYGDYLLYRTERDGRVSRAFMRFYEHKNGHLRSMGLWLDRDHEFLSSKGWVVDQGDRMLVLGHIVDRVSTSFDDMRPAGGASMLTVKLTNPDRHTISYPEAYSDHPEPFSRVQFAPVLHFRSTFEQGSSFSRGALLRLNGVEQLGGNASMDKKLRYRRIRELQTRLIKTCGKSLTAKHAAMELQTGTGLPRRIFFEDSGPSPTGLLVNRSFEALNDIELEPGSFGAIEFDFPTQGRSQTARERGRAGLHIDQLRLDKPATKMRAP